MVPLRTSIDISSLLTPTIRPCHLTPPILPSLGAAFDTPTDTLNNLPSAATNRALLCIFFLPFDVPFGHEFAISGLRNARQYKTDNVPCKGRWQISRGRLWADAPQLWRKIFRKLSALNSRNVLELSRSSPAPVLWIAVQAGSGCLPLSCYRLGGDLRDGAWA